MNESAWLCRDDSTVHILIALDVQKYKLAVSFMMENLPIQCEKQILSSNLSRYQAGNGTCEC